MNENRIYVDGKLVNKRLDKVIDDEEKKRVVK